MKILDILEDNIPKKFNRFNISGTTPEEILRDVLDIIEQEMSLKKYNVSPWDPDGAVLIAEAANWYAKQTGDYSLKVKAFAAAAEIKGVECGWGDDGCFYLSGPLQGPLCAHDPYGELYKALNFKNKNKIWEDPWDGNIRQPYAFNRLKGHNKTIKRVVSRSNRSNSENK